jgi:HEPN domain-containing protein
MPGGPTKESNKDTANAAAASSATNGATSKATSGDAVIKAFPRESDRYKIWLRQAKFDLAAAFLSLENEYYEWAAYQAEQSVEKALKAVIVQSGSKAPKIHKLGILFGFCNSINEKFRNTKFNFKHIESFTFISRYPFLIPDKNKTPHEMITEGDANKALVEASENLVKIAEILRNPSGEVSFVPAVEEGEVYSAEQIQIRIQDIKKILIKEFKPETIILIGRFARDYNKPVAGTMDILIIAETDEKFIDRIYRAREATKGGLPILEPLVYTPSEIKILREEGEAFLQSAFNEGKLIYQKGM